jgi:hypothetical protein
VEPMPTNRVELAAGGCQVTVEAAARLDTVVKKALDLWQVVNTGAVTRGESATGFAVDEPTVEIPAELLLPRRLTVEDPDERRRTGYR